MNPRAKILYVHHGSGMGGAPQLLLKFMQRLDRGRYEPVVWCIRRSSASELFEAHGFRVVYNSDVMPFLHISDGFYGITRLHRVVKMLAGQRRSHAAARAVFAEEQPDLIHLNSVVIPGVLRAASRQGCPVVLNVLECLHPGYTGFRRMLIRALSRRWADYFVFMLPSERRRWGLEEDPRAVTAFDFIDIDSFTVGGDSAALRQEFNLPEAVPLIGYLGRFTRAKGTHHLLRAAGMLQRAGVPFHLLLVGPVPETAPATWRARTKRLYGGGDYIEQLRSIIAEECLADRVTFTGERTAVAALVSGLDVLAVPFTEPHFSRLCGEAAAAGKPVVAFDIDGPGEEIMDGETGFLVPAFNEAALAGKLRYALEHPEWRAQVARRGPAHARDVFAADVNVAKVFRLYEQALGVAPVASDQ
jgi:glycosyltransferase involved in cell wall biosynthesis